MRPADSNAWTQFNYESGGMPYLPPHLRDGLRKCIECGHVFVGSTIDQCPNAANHPKESKNVALAE